jgi:hypothetical protein
MKVQLLMISRIFITHLLLDYCINRTFNIIERNFAIRSNRRLQLGDYVKLPIGTRLLIKVDASFPVELNEFVTNGTITGIFRGIDITPDAKLEPYYVMEEDEEEEEWVVIASDEMYVY